MNLKQTIASGEQKTRRTAEHDNAEREATRGSGDGNQSAINKIV